MPYHIGFISTRFSGTDGVTLEAGKWADVFEEKGHSCFWFAGQLDRDANKSILVPEAHFQDSHNQWINAQVFGKTARSLHVTEFIHGSRSFLKSRIYQFIEKFHIDLLVIENAFTIPMHIPLGLALAETIAETQIPTIAHHHDFTWERMRFSINAVNDYLQMAFPPNLSGITHVVINSEAQEQLALRTGIAATVIPNVLDFENPPQVNGEGAKKFRQTIGLKPDDKIILQPTRVIQRKGIEHAIELVRKLNDDAYKLVITHEAGDEGYEYAEWLEAHARERGVDLRLVETEITTPWSKNGHSPEAYSLWDVYAYADFITYPSLYEGFGNAFIEAVYLKKPLMVNRYSTFVRDIEPLGFKLAVMDGYLSNKTIQYVKTIMESPRLKQEIVDHNYEVAAQNFSFSILRNQIDTILKKLNRETDLRLKKSKAHRQNIVYLDQEFGSTDPISSKVPDNRIRIII